MSTVQKRIFQVSVAVVLIVLGVWITESLLEPRVRVVTLEGVPESNEPPDVTFLSGVVMDPPVRTNPFLQIFSPLENLTADIRIAPGGILHLSDTQVLFVWQVFGRQSVWQLDRSDRSLNPLVLQTTGIPAHFCSKCFPAFSAVRSAQKNLKIRPSEFPGRIDVNADGRWIEMEISVSGRALWARRARPG